MICLLDVIGMWPLLLFGGSIVILIAAIALLCIATIALTVVKWIQHRKEKEEAETAAKESAARLEE